MAPDVLRRKILKLTDLLKDLSPISEYSFEEYQDNYFIHYTAERILQLVVDVAVDINAHLLVLAGERPSSDYFSSFMKIAEIKILPVELAKEIAPSTGLRNRLVHEYDEIDFFMVYSSIDKATKLFKEYIKFMEDHLQKLERQSDNKKSPEQS